MAKLYDVFISYSQYDEKVKTAMVQYLENHGITCWYMTGRIDAGDEWRKEITRGIKNSKCFVLIYSSYSKESEQVPKEVALASENKLIMIPFKLEDIPFEDDISYEFARIQSINAFEGKISSHFEELRKTIERYAKDVDETSAPEPSKKSNKNNRKLIYAMIVAAVIVVVAGFAAYAMFSNRSSDNKDSDDLETVVTEEYIEETAEDETGEEVAEETDSAEKLVIEETEDTSNTAAGEEIAEDESAAEQESEDDQTDVDSVYEIPEDAEEYNGHYYKLYATGDVITWDDAQEQCEALGGHLATFTSEDEWEFVVNGVLDEVYNYWIGGYYDYDGFWKWVTDEDMSYQEWDTPNQDRSVTYPYMGVKDFGWLPFDEDARYVGSAYFYVKGYLCEWDSAEEDMSDVDGTETAYTIPEDAEEYDGHYYYAYSVGRSLSWDEAQEQCEQRGGHLAVVTSEEEQRFLEIKIMDSNAIYWLGGFYDIDGEWKWVTGEDMTYKEWTTPNDSESVKYPYIGIKNYGWLGFTEDGLHVGSAYYYVTNYICEWESEENAEDLQEDP